MRKQTTSRLQYQSPNPENFRIATKIQTKENLFEGEFTKNFLPEKSISSQVGFQKVKSIG